MKDYKYVLFDLDGTITDSAEGIRNSVRYALDKYGIVENDIDKLNSYVGPPLVGTFKSYGFSDEDVLKCVDLYREYFAVTGIFENRVYEGFKEMVGELKKRGKTVLVATSKPEPYARRIVEHFGLTPYFDYVAGMELDGRRGTKAEVIQYALDTMGITDVKDVLMVGDREYDILGAHSFGMDALGVLYGYGSLEELTAAGADYIAESVWNILDFIS